ncbi:MULTISPECIES: DUF6484 domain-containing protein [Methylotuvimicrobium]|uniref:DUF6484 domain-containing protein n=2 Tax=Methylotuvimicrobium TaxID=2822410 RepID=G4T2X8_META2|nr:MULTISPECIES: DUF6484 domain-containing protein [Methylotuvimicrobium]QCW82734.1 hypothetical protein EQU24_11160 [Methylotuvimicrobium buryatense]CCE23631.1 conserved protein of unknown function [Methylotuvimicrobium alcaliphilum 20Z]
MTDVLTKPTNQLYTENAITEKIDGVVVGLLIGFDGQGAPLVGFTGNPQAEAAPARSTANLTREDIGCEVALLFENGDPARPLIIGRMQQPVISTEKPNEQAFNAEIDGERVVLQANQEIVLRCGKASITLTRAGKIIIRGAYILNRSSGVNRIKGGSVQIN